MAHGQEGSFQEAVAERVLEENSRNELQRVECFLHCNPSSGELKKPSSLTLNLLSFTLTSKPRRATLALGNKLFR